MKNSILDFRTQFFIGQDKNTGKVERKEVKEK